MNDSLADQPFDVRVFVAVEKSPLCIAAVIYDVASGQELAYFTQLVGESDDMHFPEVLAELKQFCGYHPIWTFNKEQDLLERYCTDFSIPFPFYAPFIRVRSLLRGWGLRPRGYSKRALYEAAGLEADGQSTGALQNARYLAAAVSHFENRSV